MKLWNNLKGFLIRMQLMKKIPLKMHFVLGCYDIMTYKPAWVGVGGGVNKYFKKFIDKNGSWRNPCQKIHKVCWVYINTLLANIRWGHIISSQWIHKNWTHTVHITYGFTQFVDWHTNPCPCMANAPTQSRQPMSWLGTTKAANVTAGHSHGSETHGCVRLMQLNPWPCTQTLGQAQPRQPKLYFYFINSNNIF